MGGGLERGVAIICHLYAVAGSLSKYFVAVLMSLFMPCSFMLFGSALNPFMHIGKCNEQV